MVVDVSYKNGAGVYTDVIGVRKYHEMGNPEDPFYPDNFKGIPAIIIERSAGKEVELLFDSYDDRDRTYNEIVHQINKQI